MKRPHPLARPLISINTTQRPRADLPPIVSDDGNEISVEVKSTTAARFSFMEISGSEWRAAKLRGKHYVIALVTNAMSDNTCVALLWDPDNMESKG